MPVSTQVRSFIRNDNQMEGAGRDSQITARADVLLDCLVGLDRADCYVENRAHAITAMITTTVRTIRTTSTIDLSCSRNGLNPTPRR